MVPQGGGWVAGFSSGGGDTQTRAPLLGPLRSHVPGGQKGRQRMCRGVLLLGLTLAGSKQPEAPPVFVVGRSGERLGGGKIPPQGFR